jgi:ADP-heptose:LPS heptosyltransferase
LSTQTDTLERVGPFGRVAVLRLRSLGDCVLSTPAICLLKQARPDLRVGVVVEDRFAAVFENNDDITAIMPPTARVLREFEPELCLNLHGGTRSARLTLLSGARFRAGFAIFRPGWIYNTPVPTAQETMGINRRVHTAEHMASAMFYLGVPIGEVPRAKLMAAPGRSRHAPDGPYAVIHGLAATPEKTWPAEHFRELARFLEQCMGLQTVFIGGPGEDLTPFEPYRGVAGAPLGEVVKLMRDAAFFAGNDSGPAHVAAAFGIPQVVIFGPSDAEVWAPWRTPAEILKTEAAIGDIPVARAIEAVERLRLVTRA